MRWLALALSLFALTACDPDANPWLGRRVLHVVHSGGYQEGPENSLYAMKTSLAKGADMLEFDVRLSGDDRVVVFHGPTLGRNTQGSGRVRDHTLAELESLDVGYWSAPPGNTLRGLPAEAYVFRGMATGDRPPPPGFEPSDFRIPTLREVLETFPDVLMSIEIKDDIPADDLEPTVAAVAGLLAEFGRQDDVLVASFDDTLIARFKQLAPEVDTSPGLGAAADYVLLRLPLEGHAALQLPRLYFGLNIITESFVADAHRDGLAVIVFVFDDEERAEVYRELVDKGVDGVMVGKPSVFEPMLAAQGLRGETGLVIASGRWDGARDEAVLEASCPATAITSCHGTLALVATETGPCLGSGLGALAGLPECERDPKPSSEARFDLARGTTAAVPVPLGHALRRRLRGGEDLEVRAVVAPGDEHGRAVEARFRLAH